MSPKNLIILGTFVSVSASVFLFFSHDPSYSILVFGGGALFGKGYAFVERGMGGQDGV